MGLGSSGQQKDSADASQVDEIHFWPGQTERVYHPVAKVSISQGVDCFEESDDLLIQGLPLANVCNDLTEGRLGHL